MELATPPTNGRDICGRFTLGNGGGPGNPLIRRVARARAAIADAVTDEDVADIIRALVRQAKAGDVMAAREVLDRVAGRVKLEAELAVNARPEVGADAFAGMEEADLRAIASLLAKAVRPGAARLLEGG
jgi:hypothetical protein